MRPAQPDLFSYTPPPRVERALARATDPNTSRQAANSVTPILPELEALVLKSLRAAGRNGMTLDELVDDTGLDKVTVSPRLKPLCRKDLAKAEGTRLGKAGRQQTIWIAVK